MLQRQSSVLFTESDFDRLSIQLDGIEAGSDLHDKVGDINNWLGQLKQSRSTLFNAIAEVSQETLKIIQVYRSYDQGQAFIRAIIRSVSSALYLAKNIQDEKIKKAVIAELEKVKSETQKLIDSVRKFMLWAESIIPQKYLSTDLTNPFDFKKGIKSYQELAAPEATEGLNAFTKGLPVKKNKRFSFESNDPQHRPFGTFTNGNPYKGELQAWLDDANENEYLTVWFAKNNRGDHKKIAESEFPSIIYFDEEERLAYQVVTRSDKLYYASSRKVVETVNTSDADGSADLYIYVMDTNGRLFIAKDGAEIIKDKKRYQIGHASLSAGKKVACAGTIVVENGKVISLSERSEYYTPGEYSLSRVVSELERRKVMAEACQVEFQSICEYFAPERYLACFANEDDLPAIDKNNITFESKVSNNQPNIASQTRIYLQTKNEKIYILDDLAGKNTSEVEYVKAFCRQHNIHYAADLVGAGHITFDANSLIKHIDNLFEDKEAIPATSSNLRRLVKCLVSEGSSFVTNARVVDGAIRNSYVTKQLGDFKTYIAQKTGQQQIKHLDLSEKWCPVHFLNRMSDINQYLSKRAGETNGLLAFFGLGYSGRDYYARRDSWVSIINSLASAKDSADIENIRNKIETEIVKFRHGKFRNEYADRLKKLADELVVIVKHIDGNDRTFFADKLVRAKLEAYAEIYKEMQHHKENTETYVRDCTIFASPKRNVAQANLAESAYGYQHRLDCHKSLVKDEFMHHRDYFRAEYSNVRNKY